MLQAVGPGFVLLHTLKYFDPPKDDCMFVRGLANASYMASGCGLLAYQRQSPKK